MYEIRAAHILLRRKLSERKANADKKACKNCIFLLCILPSCPQKIVAGQETQNEKRRWKTKWLLPTATTLSTNAREAMNRFKMEAASEVGVNLKQGYNGDLTSRQAGSIGGQMVKKMIAAYENGMQ